VADPNQKKHDKVEIRSVRLGKDNQTVFLEIPGLQPVDQMKIRMSLKAADGTAINPGDLQHHSQAGLRPAWPLRNDLAATGTDRREKEPEIPLRLLLVAVLTDTPLRVPRTPPACRCGGNPFRHFRGAGLRRAADSHGACVNTGRATPRQPGQKSGRARRGAHPRFGGRPSVDPHSVAASKPPHRNNNIR